MDLFYIYSYGDIGLVTFIVIVHSSTLYTIAKPDHDALQHGTNRVPGCRVF